MKKLLKDETIFQLEQIVDNLPGNVYWKDAQDKFLGCNENVARILKPKSPKDIIGKTDEEVLGKKYAELVREINDRVLKNGEEISIEEIGFNEKGEKAIYLSTKKPLFDKKNKIVGLIGTSLDITQQKKLKENLKTETEFLTNLEETASVKPLKISSEKLEIFYEFYRSYFLSRREAESLYYTVRGMTQKQIAKKLGLSYRTVEFYVNNAKLKLGSRNKLEMIAKVFESGII